MTMIRLLSLSLLLFAAFLIPSGASAQIQDPVMCYEAGMDGGTPVSDPVACATCAGNGGTWQTDPAPGQPACKTPLAPGSTRPETQKLVNLLPEKASTLKGVIDVLLETVVQVGSILLVISLMWTGFLFIQAQGKEEQIRNARSALMWCVLGGLLLLGAQTLSLIISSAITSL